MKIFVGCLLGAVLLVGSRPVSAFALDEVEVLLYGESSATAGDAVVDGAQASDAQTALPSQSDLILEDHGDSYVSAVSLDVPAATSNQAAHEDASTFGITAVPEPSAIALGVLALIYFLVFGRRRYYA